jgi:hypothetical protein
MLICGSGGKAERGVVQTADLRGQLVEDLGQGDLVKVDCAACHHVALLTPEFLRRLGLSPQAKVLDLKGRVRCRGCGAGDEPSCRSSGGARVCEPAQRSPPGGTATPQQP